MNRRSRKMEEATAEDAGPGGRDGAVDVGTDAREDHRGTSAASAAASLRLPLQLAQGDEGPRTVTPSEHPEDIGIATQATAPGLDDGDI